MSIQDQQVIHLLVIEDDQKYAEYIKSILTEITDTYDISIVPSLREGIEVLKETKIDFVISNLNLPDSEGFDKIDKIHQIRPNLPVLILTDVDDAQLGVDAINHGATDSLSKDNVEAQLLHRMVLYGLERQKIIRELEENRSKLLQVQKMEAIVTLVGGVSHDFNNLITLINGYSELIANHPDTTSTIENYNEEIRKASKRAARLIEQLSTFSNTEGSVAKKLHINDSIQESHTILSKVIREDVELEINLEATDDAVFINPVNFEQILFNIVLNARQAIESTGSIKVSTKNIDSCPFADIDGKLLLLEITDDGSGIPPQQLSQIFDPYFTTRDEGTGLGLSTVYGLVQQAGGVIDVDSKLGYGTTMKICLPLFDEEISGVPEELIHASSSKIKDGQLLIVDDEEKILELLSNLLTGEGFDVITRSNPKQALESIRDGSIDPVFVISDIVMPEMSGIDLYTEIKKTDAKIPIMLMSGYSSKYYKDFSDQMSLLKKPFSKAEVLSKINETLQYGADT